MTSALILSLLIKAVSAAAVVVTATYIAERAGPFWGAIIACLPISAGPACVMLAMEQPADFISQSALLSFATNAAMALFIAVMAVLASRIRGWFALFAATAVWAAGAFAIHAVEWTVALAMIVNLATFALSYAIARRWLKSSNAVAAGKPRWSDLALRAALVGALSAGVVGGSEALGPAATGILAVFPVVFTSMGIILLPRIGAAATATMMVMALPPLGGFTFGLLVVHLGTAAYGSAWGLTLGLITTLVWSLGIVLTRRPWSRGSAKPV